MNEGIKKFEELLRTDESFQTKLKAAVESYAGENTEEAVFNGVLLPVAKEYGISVSYEELHDYISNLAQTDETMDKDELKRIMEMDPATARGRNRSEGREIDLSPDREEVERDTKMRAAVYVDVARHLAEAVKMARIGVSEKELERVAQDALVEMVKKG